MVVRSLKDVVYLFNVGIFLNCINGFKERFQFCICELIQRMFYFLLNNNNSGGIVYFVMEFSVVKCYVVQEGVFYFIEVENMVFLCMVDRYDIKVDE